MMFDKISFVIENKSVKRDIIIVSLIVLLPIAFYIYNIVPDDVKVWKTKWFAIDSGYHDGVKYYLWLLSVKFLTLFILSIWFVTCTKKWRIVILIPVIVEIYKILIVVLAAKSGYVITDLYIESLFYSIPYVFILFILSNMLGYYKKSIDLQLNKEINELLLIQPKLGTKEYKKINKDLLELRKHKYKMEKKKYLIKLISLRDQMTI